MEHNRLNDLVIAAFSDPSEDGTCKDARVVVNHDDKNLKAVLIASDRRNQKYIIAVGEGKRFFASAPKEDCSYHNDIFCKLKYADPEAKKANTVRGGYLYVHEDGKVELWGSSEGFGRADHRKVAALLRNLGVKTNYD